MRVRPLNHPQRMFGTRGVRPKHENRIRQRVGDHDFVTRGIVCQAVDRASQKSILSRNQARRRCISVCQPGKHRDARLSHSIGHQKLVAFGIVGKRHGIAKPGRRCPGGSAPDDPLGAHIAARSAVKCECGMIAPV